MKEGEIEIEEKEQGTKKRGRDRRTTAKRKKAEKDPSTLEKFGQITSTQSVKV